MFRLKSHAATFALVIGLLTTFNQTARAESWSWENILSVFSSANAVAVCTTDPVVVNGLDSGAGSLRQAVIDACPDSTITFSDSMVPMVSLSSGQIVIDKNLTIAGPGADVLTVRNIAGAVFNSRIFMVNPGVTAAVSGLTISGGVSNNVQLVDGSLFLQGGGGIHNRGNLTLADSIVTDNSARFHGGGINNAGNLTVARSIITENRITERGRNFYFPSGGGIYSESGTVTVTDSTVSFNRALFGGGIFVAGGTFDFTRSSLVRNFAPEGGSDDPFAQGGGLHVAGGSSVTLTNSTVSGNTLGRCSSANFTCDTPGISSGGSLTLNSSTVADLSSGANISNNSIIAGNGTDYRLSPLGFYGGATETRALFSGSPAINAGNTATAPATDQRGAARVGAADIGAFELNNSAVGGAFRVGLPDGLINNAYSFMLVQRTEAVAYSLTGGALPPGISLSTADNVVTVEGTTAQTGVFNFSVTATNGTNSFVTDYSVRFLYSDTPPTVGCISNPVVANRSDAGAGSLRQAVIDACPGSTITFGNAVVGRISLSTRKITIDKNLTIAGPGADLLTIRMAHRAQFFRIQTVGVLVVNGGVTAAISGLTISNGDNGIYNAGNLTVTDSTVSDNYRGAGIRNGGNLTVARSFISRNGILEDSLGRGGIYSTGASLTITDSTISGNLAQPRFMEGGGGIWSENLLTISRSTISNNTVAGSLNTAWGGGIANKGTATITNSTVSNNKLFQMDRGYGGGIYNRGTLSLVNSTVAQNKIDLVCGDCALGEGAGIYQEAYTGGTFTARNSIIEGNSILDYEPGPVINYFNTSSDFDGTLTSQGYNLIGNTSETTITGDTTGNLLNTDARLAPLADNGGRTPTHALLTGSPAVNAANTATAPASDQRGAARVGAADIGAFEFGSTPPALAADLTVAKTHTGNFTQGDTGRIYSITVSNSGAGATSGTVSVTDALPAGLAAFNISGVGWNCNLNNLTCQRADALAAGTAYPTITLTVSVGADAPASVTNIATVSGGGEINTANNQASDPTTIIATPKYSIAGIVRYGTTVSGQPDSLVTGVNLNATGAGTTSAVSNVSGIYQLLNLSGGGNITVTPAKSGQINGITSFDATLVLRCVAAGTSCILTNNQKIAADTNNSSTITSFDATQILRFAAANARTALTGQVGNWKFNPVSRSYNPLSTSFSNQNYDAILVGEINGSWNSAGSFAENNANAETETEKNSLAFDASSPDLSPAEGESIENDFSKTDLSRDGDNDVEISLPENIGFTENEFVRIPIQFQNKTGKQISAFRFAVRFNPSILQPDENGFESNENQIDGFAIASDTASPGKLRIAAARTGNNVLESGTLLYLRFRIVKTTLESPRRRAAAVLVFDQSSPNAAIFEDNTGNRVSVTTSNRFLGVN